MTDDYGYSGPPFMKNSSSYGKINFEIGNLPDKNLTYKIDVVCHGGLGCSSINRKPDANEVIKSSWSFDSTNTGSTIEFVVTNSTYTPPEICNYTILPSDWLTAPSPTLSYSTSCSLTLNPSTDIKPDTSITLNGIININPPNPTLRVMPNNAVSANPDSGISISNNSGGNTLIKPQDITYNYNNDITFSHNIGKFIEGEYQINASIPLGRRIASPGGGEAYLTETETACSISFESCVSTGCGVLPTPTPVLPFCPPPLYCVPKTMGSACSSGSYSTVYTCNQPSNACCIPAAGADCGIEPCIRADGCDYSQCKTCPKCLAPILSPSPILSNTPVPGAPDLVLLCDKLPPPYDSECKKCSPEQVWTALGCVSVEGPKFFTEAIFGVGIGMAGGIAFLYFIYGAFLFMTSAGNAEKVTQGKEIIVSALSGLILIIFSVFLLNIIGVQILDLPFFAK
jgi:hypothetical protein